MRVKLKAITKRNIEATTGVAFPELLSKDPVRDPRLRKLTGRRAPAPEDPLVRGNPELTMGYVTTLEEVDAYFDEKTKERRDQGERCGRERT